MALRNITINNSVNYVSKVENKPHSDTHTKISRSVENSPPEFSQSFGKVMKNVTGEGYTLNK